MSQRIGTSPVGVAAIRPTRESGLVHPPQTESTAKLSRLFAGTRGATLRPVSSAIVFGERPDMGSGRGR